MQEIDPFVDELVQTLKLLPHPEGGFYRETYRSTQLVDTPFGKRSAGTAIYFLLTQKHFSAFHKIRSDETWHFYAGAPVKVHCISPDGEYSLLHLGNHPEKGQVFQGMVPAGHWFASETIEHPGYALVGCTVAPGFDFADFELAERAGLSDTFPQYKALIARLTR